jgi:hypothetical protein
MTQRATNRSGESRRPASTTDTAPTTATPPAMTPYTAIRTPAPSTSIKTSRPTRAERHARADLYGPLAHRVRHDSVDPERRHQQRRHRWVNSDSGSQMKVV